MNRRENKERKNGNVFSLSKIEKKIYGGPKH